MGIGSYVNGVYQEKLYQDLWIRGAAMQVGGRGCRERYEAIENYLSQVKGPIKVLDIGANMGYFSFRLAERFFGHFVMIENAPSTVKRLLQLCLMNANPQITFLATRVTFEGLKQLLQEEQFDVIIALSVIHHFDEPFNDIVHLLASHAKHVILEHASPDERSCPNASRVRAEPLNLSPYNPTKIISTTATGYNTIFRDVYGLKGLVSEERTPPEGISLKNYAHFSGLYPHPTSLQPQVKKMKDKESARLIKGKAVPA